MKYYLGAHFPRRDDLRRYAKKLEAKGHTITSAWLYEETGVPWDAIAERDEADVTAADIVLIFTGPFTADNGEPYPGMRGAGHQIEYGLARGLGKKLIVIGPAESPLHQFKGVDRFPTFNKYLKSIGG